MKVFKYLAFILTAAFFLAGWTSADPVNLRIAPRDSSGNPKPGMKTVTSLEEARNTIRRLNKNSRKQGVTVWMAGGTYYLEESFELDRRDSGTKAGPIVYRAEEGAKVHVIGGKHLPIPAFKPVTDKEILQKTELGAHGKLLACDLKSLGIKDYGQKSAKGLAQGTVPELFFNDEPLPISRWPNSGWAKYGKVIDKGSMPRRGEKPDRPGTIEYVGDRPDRWKNAENIWLHGYFAFDWFDDVLKVAKLDTEQKRITFTTPHAYGLSPQRHYRVIGLLEEIDQPGEWTIDLESGVLYLFPPEHFADARITLSMVDKPMIRMNRTSHITIHGLVLEMTRGDAVVIEGGTDNLIAGCTLRNIGRGGVVVRPYNPAFTNRKGLYQVRKESGKPLKDGRRNGVVGCDLFDIGGTGISLDGGDRITLNSGEHYAINNDIHHFARRHRTYRPGIELNGVGLRAAHNYIHDAPHVGLNYSGNDHVIEFNEVARVCEETGDVGVFYSGRDWTYRGNIVRHNFIHHIRAPGELGSNAIYLDDCHSSTCIYGNVFYKVQVGAFIGGGHDNIVENNLFIDSDQAVHIDSRGQGWAQKFQKRGGDHKMFAKLEAVKYDKPPYSTRYPKLAQILQGDPHAPQGNKVLNNVCFRSGWIHGPASLLELKNNWVTQTDPGFTDVEQMDFTLEKDAPLLKEVPGFKPIPFHQIGLLQDQYRQINLER